MTQLSYLALLAAPVVDIDGTAFLQGGLFLLLVGLLQPLLFKPWLEVQARRTEQIDGAIKKASELETRAAEAEAKCTKQIADARNTAIAHRSERRVAKEGEGAEILASARAEATATLAAERARLEGELTKARAALESKVDELADEITAKVLGRSA